MSPATDRLQSNDIAKLKQIITQQQAELEKSKGENTNLKQQITLLRKLLFGPKSEKQRPEDEKQSLLFDEAEANSSDSNSRKAKKSRVRSHERKKPGRKPLPADIPRIEIVHDLKDEEKVCECGEKLNHIGVDESERLEIIPAEIYVEHHIRHKYTCKKCEGLTDESKPAIRTAPVAPQLIPKSIATSGFLAYAITAKFCDSLPFYRQSKIFLRHGIELPHATLCNWAIQIYERSKRLRELLWDELLKGPLIGIDETTVQVLKEPGRKNTTKSFMWIFRGGTAEKPIVYFEYRPTRNAGFLNERLVNYSGCIQTDGYSGYDFLEHNIKIVHAGCWSHARRKFIEFKDALEDTQAADEILDLIGELYDIEKQARKQKLSCEQLLDLRKKESLPIAESLKDWLDAKVVTAPPTSLLGKAVRYTLNEWKKLIVFLNDGNIHIDNNHVENSIRPFVVGRKNWLFSGSPRGAHASAFLYSIVESAKACGHEPYWYMRFLFENLPLAESDDDIKSLLPNRLNPESVPNKAMSRVLGS